MSVRFEVLEVGAFHLRGAIPIEVAPIESQRDRELAASVFWMLIERDERGRGRTIDDFPTRELAMRALERNLAERSAAQQRREREGSGVDELQCRRGAAPGSTDVPT